MTTSVDLHWLEHAIELSRKSPPSSIAFSVGAVLVDATGREVASGWSRDSGPHVHAEESALLRATGELSTVTLYSTLEPCTERRSGPRPCAELVIAAGIRRVVLAWREPPLFVPDCQGVERLTEAGVTVVEAHELEQAAREVNRHLPGVFH